MTDPLTAENAARAALITVGATQFTALLTYPDGSSVQMVMPRPEGLENMTLDQVEQLARRTARRLLVVAREDLI